MVQAMPDVSADTAPHHSHRLPDILLFRQRLDDVGHLSQDRDERQNSGGGRFGGMAVWLYSRYMRVAKDATHGVHSDLVRGSTGHACLDEWRCRRVTRFF